MAQTNPIDGAIGPAIDALEAFVFFTVPIFGVEAQLLVLILAAAMVFFTFWLGVPQIGLFRHGLQVVRGKYADPSAPGFTTHAQALTTALSGTVGLGNIAGVAIAIATGGPGAAFWMFVIGLFAMALKMAEVTLGLKYRLELPNGEVYGGPMYTLARGLAARGKNWGLIGLVLGGCYAIFALGGGLPMLQTNQSYEQVAAVTGLRDVFSEADARLIYGFVMAGLVAIVVFGSARWLGRVTGGLVPLMAGIYLLACLVILIANAAALPAALAAIVVEAFAPQAVAGGALGAFIVGMRRAVYSSEAGIGSAVMAHSLAKTRQPVSEGSVALLEPFIDTVIICTMSALVIVVTGAHRLEGLEGVAITSSAFASVLPWFPYVLAVAVFLFAYSTLISWGYYGLQAWSFLFGRAPLSITLFKVLYCLLTPLGAILPLGKVVSFVDSMFFLMVAPNLIALALFAGELRRDVREYRRRLAGQEAFSRKNI